MKKYFIHNGKDHIGPFDLSELKAKGITPETLVWCDGMADWMLAGKVDELKVLFENTVPPPLKANLPPKNNSSGNKIEEKVVEKVEKKKSKNRLIIAMVSIFVVCLVLLYIYNKSSSSSGSYSTASVQTYQEKVMTVEEIERSQPLNFLSADGNYNSNFWGDKLKVHGEVKNTATVASYKDAVVRVTYYSKTKTILGTNDYTIYENFPPHSEVKFELKIQNYKNVNSIGWDVVSAIPN